MGSGQWSVVRGPYKSGYSAKDQCLIFFGKSKVISAINHSMQRMGGATDSKCVVNLSNEHPLAIVTILWS